MVKLPRKIRIFYSLGQLGWSILAGIIGTWLVYFYLPPAESGINVVIPQDSVFMGVTMIGVIMGFNTLINSLTDLWVASRSDRSKHRLGRRTPFLRRSALPCAVMLVCIFVVPFQDGIHTFNSIWLFILLPLYSVAFTFYVIPYTALLSELGRSTEDRIDLSTYISVTWFLGLIIATFAPNIWEIVMTVFDIPKTAAIQWTFAGLAAIAFILMLIPGYTIDENKYGFTHATSLDVKSSVKSILQNKDFRSFLTSELGYWFTNTFFQSSLVYYITVLARQKETDVGVIVAAVGVLSFLLYPLVNRLSKRYGKKKLMIVSFVFLIVSFIYIALMGMLPFDGFIQLIPIIILSAVTSAISGILPNAIIADCAVYDASSSGENKEALYFGVRSFITKFGSALSVILLPTLLAIGNSVHNDSGIRISVIVAAFVALLSLLAFLKYDEKKISASPLPIGNLDAQEPTHHA
ncbi:MFS transporter [Paenibacillus sp. N1-5-1-14]|uniref:MFS transporter n=1 Tax=Paenibacillus radicibacter TaxID=2972488 RepID=UPI0021592DE6|nr:MFS transporter [Paenibacillus radicibacter]MCR8643397.1 MFS transporter [Paenibacillus radicibacter]